MGHNELTKSRMNVLFSACMNVGADMMDVCGKVSPSETQCGGRAAFRDYITLTCSSLTS